MIKNYAKRKLFYVFNKSLFDISKKLSWVLWISIILWCLIMLFCFFSISPTFSHIFLNYVVSLENLSKAILKIARKKAYTTNFKIFPVLYRQTWFYRFNFDETFKSCRTGEWGSVFLCFMCSVCFEELY